MSTVLKRGLLFTFIIALVVAISACGNNSAQTNTQGKSTGTKTTDNKTKTDSSKTTPAKTKTKDNSSKSTDTSATAKKMDLGGRTVVFDCWWNDSPTQDKSALGKKRVAQMHKVEQEYNIKIKYVVTPYNDVVKKMTASILAGKPVGDFIRLQNDWAMAAAAKDQLLPVKSYAPDMSKYKHIVAGAKFYGNNYSLGTPWYGWDGIYYNRSIFKKLNLPDPHQLMKEGKWNWSEFEAIAKKATNPTEKTWGFSGTATNAAMFMLTSNDAHLVDMNSGKVNLSDPKVTQAFDFLHKIYDVDHVVKIEPKSSPIKGQEDTTFKDGDVAMTFGWDWRKWKKIDFGFVPFPMGPAAKTYENPYVTGGSNSYFIPKGVKNPEALVSIYNDLNAVKSPEDYPNQNWFEGQLNHQDDIDAAKKIAYAPYFTVGFTFFKNFPNTDIVKDIIVNGKNVESTLHSYQHKAQAAVDAQLKS